jgi:hypothetical protein
MQSLASVGATMLLPQAQQCCCRSCSFKFRNQKIKRSKKRLEIDLQSHFPPSLAQRMHFQSAPNSAIVAACKAAKMSVKHKQVPTLKQKLATFYDTSTMMEDRLA